MAQKPCFQETPQAIILHVEQTVNVDILTMLLVISKAEKDLVQLQETEGETMSMLSIKLNIFKY